MSEGDLAARYAVSEAMLRALPPGPCDLCGTIGELRPYGPHREQICFACGMKHRETTELRFEQSLGEETHE